MLIKATIEDVKKYGEFAYGLALDPAKSCYPTYADGIKTKDDFFNEAERAVTTGTSELLLFSIDGNVEGWISYFEISEDKYLQLNGFNINRGTQQALSEFLELIEGKFSGYTAYFGYPSDNREAIEFLADHGFRCIEREWNHSIFFDEYRADGYSPCVEKISRHNFNKFRTVYHPSSETYWNADRILKTIEDWTIFVYNQADIPIAAAFLTGDDGYCEMYGIEFDDGVFRENVFRELLTACLNECKCAGVKYMTYFCGEKEKAVMCEPGFRCVGQYVLYTRAL